MCVSSLPAYFDFLELFRLLDLCCTPLLCLIMIKAKEHSIADLPPHAFFDDIKYPYLEPFGCMLATDDSCGTHQVLKKGSTTSLLRFCGKLKEVSTSRRGALPNLPRESQHSDTSPCKCDGTISSFACSQGFDSVFVARSPSACQCAASRFYKKFNQR